MKWLLVLASTSVLYCGSSDAFDQPSTPVSEEAIHLLILQLGSEDYREREAATARLEKIGPPALNGLRWALRSDRPEIRNRAAAILGKIERADDSALRLTAKRVKLDYTDIPLGTAVNDLRVLTGLNIALDPNRVADPLRKITCHTGDVPIWEAVDAFCAAAEVHEVFRAELETPKSQSIRRTSYTSPPPSLPSAENVRIELVDGKESRLPGDRSTAVRVVALPASFPGHKVTLGTGEVSFCLDVTPTPGLGWQEATGVKITRVVDSFGRAGSAAVERVKPVPIDPDVAMLLGRGGVAFRIEVAGNFPIPETYPNPRIVRVPFRLATPEARLLKRLEGTVFAELRIPNQHLITVAELKRFVNIPFSGPGDVKLTIQEAKDAETDSPGMILVRLEYPSLWLQNLQRRFGRIPGWPEAPPDPSQGLRIEAFDAAGQPFPAMVKSCYEGSENGITDVQTVTLEFRAAAGFPAKLVAIGPKPVVVQIPFVLENVPLP